MDAFIEGVRRYYGKEYDVTPLLLGVQSSFSSSITEINPIFVALIDKLLNANPSKYWNRKTAQQVFDKLESCLSPGIPTFSFKEDAIEYFLMGYNAYEQLSETWADIHDFNISPETKTRFYRLPMYTSIVEGCLSRTTIFVPNCSLCYCLGSKCSKNVVNRGKGGAIGMGLSFPMQPQTAQKKPIENHFSMGFWRAILDSNQWPCA